MDATGVEPHLSVDAGKACPVKLVMDCDRFMSMQGIRYVGWLDSAITIDVKITGLRGV